MDGCVAVKGCLLELVRWSDRRAAAKLTTFSSPSVVEDDEAVRVSDIQLMEKYSASTDSQGE